MSENRTTPYLLRQYRILRRGLLTLPALEESVGRDIAEVDRIVQVEQHTDLELVFASQALELLVGTLEESVASLIVLEEFAANEPRFEDLAIMEEIANDKVRDERTRELILTTLRVHGGLLQLLEAEKMRLDSKLRIYSRALVLAQGGDVAAFQDAKSHLERVEGSHVETLVGYWRRRLAEETEATGGRPYFSTVVFELCTKHPEIAQELGVDCASIQYMPPVLWLIVILCAILCKGDS